MRLETISKSLASQLSKSSDPDSMFEDIFWRCAKQLSPSDFGLLNFADLENQLSQGVLPDKGDFSAVRDDLDAKYFDAEDQGKLDLSERYFALARLMAALDFYQGCSSKSDLSDAVYEAIMSTSNPSETAKNIETVF